MKELYSMWLSLIMLLAAGAAAAQPGNPPPGTIEQRTVVRSDTGVAPVMPAMLEQIVTGGLLDDTFVRNQPLAAVFESETVQTLTNGTSITRLVTTRIYRDKEGRTRREQIFHRDDGGAAAPAPGEAAPIISVYDPVARYGYSINPATRAAQRYKLPATPAAGAPFYNRIPQSIEILRSDAQQSGATGKYTLEPPVVRSLGRQTIAGVEAEGVRVTFKVPAGAIGNAAAVETIYETWIARDLRMLVKSLAKNPLSGEHRLQLTTINRAEQPRLLFEVPAGYTLSDMGAPRPGLAPPR